MTKSKTSEYRCRRDMIDRCYNKRNAYYKDYGGRGIFVCQRWLDSFDSFIEDLGYKPSPELSLDRINNNDGYYKKNCRWATRSQQRNNRRSSIPFLSSNKAICSRCKKVIKKTNFYLSPKRSSGVRSYCIKCSRVIQHERKLYFKEYYLAVTLPKRKLAGNINK